MKRTLPWLVVTALMGAAAAWAVLSPMRQSDPIAEADAVLTIETKDIARVLASDHLSACAALKMGDKDRYYLPLRRTGTGSETLEAVSRVATVLTEDRVSATLAKEKNWMRPETKRRVRATPVRRC